MYRRILLEKDIEKTLLTVIINREISQTKLHVIQIMRCLLHVPVAIHNFTVLSYRTN